MKRVFVSALLASIVMAAMAQPQLCRDNIDEIVTAMTLEEKITLVIGGANAAVVDGIASGLVNEVPGAAGKTRPVGRLGIPNVLLADGPAGLRINPTREGEERTYYCTAFPVGTLLASSWDTALVQRMTQAMGDEVREYGVDVLLAPGANIHRNPLCGRNFEYFSEDPVLSGRMAAAYINGLQDSGVGACLKHFAANNQETNRVENNAVIGVRALREIYLKNFEIAIRESNPWSIMSSYNRLNGPYTQQSEDLLTKVLREDWGYEGVVMTDWGRKPDTHLSVLAGNDLYEPGTDSEMQRLRDAVADGRLPEEALDKCVRHILELVVKTPHFNHYAYSSRPDLAAHASIARQTAAESMVLLRNRNATLPFKGSEKLAVYGLGAIDLIPGGTGSGSVNKAYTKQLDASLKDAGFVVDDDILAFYRDYRKADAASARMSGRKSTFTANVLAEPDIPANAVNLHAANNDAAVIVIRRNAGEGADRTVDGIFELSAGERTLLRRVSDAFHRQGKRVVVILNIDGVIETASWKSLVDAILLPWTPGQDGADAIADVLTGKVNPSGKLPMTFPSSYMDHLSSRNFPLNDGSEAPEDDFMTVVAGVMGLDLPKKEIALVDYTEYKEGIWVGYRYFNTADIEVSYPFGFGLSYTSFDYSKPVVKAGKDGFVASITVTNTGNAAGKEAVQLYVTAPSAGLDKPAKELKAFAKTRLLAPGESQTLTFAVPAYDLASFNAGSNAWETASGLYTVHFGASVSDILCQGTVTVKNALAYPVSDAFQNVELEEYTLQ